MSRKIDKIPYNYLVLVQEDVQMLLRRRKKREERKVGREKLENFVASFR